MPIWMLENDYDDYCWECEQEGITPMIFEVWVQEQENLE